MRIRDFLGMVRELVGGLLPPERRSFQWRFRFNLLQLYYLDPAVHYEAWVQRKTGRIEVGLHFEGEREENYRWAGLLADRLAEIQGQLGPALELEEWTRSWTRFHESIPLRTLDESLAEQVAERLARLMTVLEPILEEERPGVTAEGG